MPRLAGATVVCVGLLGTGVAAATDLWTRSRYLMTPDEAALRTARMLDAMGQCAICLSSRRGAVDIGTLMADLEATAPSILTRHGPIAPGYDEWIAMPGLVRTWYLEATGREPSTGDFGHHLYQWREEHVPADEIRRRIFAAAGKEAP